MTTLTIEQKQHLELAKQGKVDARDVAFLTAIPRPTHRPTVIRTSYGVFSID